MAYIMVSSAVRPSEGTGSETLAVTVVVDARTTRHVAGASCHSS